MSPSIKFGPLLCLEDRSLPSAYFVATTGNDLNTGSIDSPVATIQHALNLATRPGDSVQVRGGTYHEKLKLPASGTARDGYITLSAFPGEQPVLDGAGVAGNNMIWLKNVSFVKVKGFEITNLTGVTDGSGIRVEGYGSNIEIRDNVIHEIRGANAMGITVFGNSTLKPIVYLTIDGNEIYDAEPAPREALTLNGNITQFSVTGNTVHDVNNVGIDMVGGDRSINRSLWTRNGVVRGNTVYNAHSPIGDRFAAGIYVDGGQNIVLEYNVSHHNDVGIEIGAENRNFVARNIAVRNNLIYLNDKAGVAVGGYQWAAGRAKSNLFVNNTVYQNDTQNSGFGQLWIQYASGNAITSNLFVAADNNVLIASAAGNSGNRLNNNLYYSDDGDSSTQFSWNGIGYIGLTNFQTKTRADAGSLFGDPSFVDAATGDFKLQSDSFAIDTASKSRNRFALTDFTGRLRPTTSPDIGALEYFEETPAGPGLSPIQKRRAEQLTSIFENATTELQYAFIQALGDGRGYTGGRAGFTTATGDLLDVVERYTARVGGNPLATYLPRLRQLGIARSGSVSGLTGIVTAWQSAAGDQVFRSVQDEVVDETYYEPVVVRAAELGLQDAISVGQLYDAIIQHGEGTDLDGLPALLGRTALAIGGTPATGVNEHAWLNAFLQMRRENLARSFNPATRAVWAESVSRVDVYLDLVASGNRSLSGPIEVRSDHYGHFTIA